MKLCIACGMPMEKKEDFAMEDETLAYCKFCVRPDGTMQTYDEKLEGMAEFIVRSQGMDREAAKRAAACMMAALPAWQAKA